MRRIWIAPVVALVLTGGVGVGAWWSPRSHSASAVRTSVNKPHPQTAPPCPSPLPRMVLAPGDCMPSAPTFVRTASSEVTPMEGEPGSAADSSPLKVTSTIPVNAGPLFYNIASNTPYTITRANAYDWSGHLVGHLDATTADGQPSAPRITPSPDGQQLFIDGQVYSPQGHWLRTVGGWGATWSADSKSLCTLRGPIRDGRRYLDIEYPANVLHDVASLPPGGVDWGNGIALCNPAAGLVVVDFYSNTIVGGYTVIHVGRTITVDSFALQRHGSGLSEDMVPSPDGKTLAVTDNAYGWISLLDVTTGKAKSTQYNGTPRIFLDATTLLASSDYFNTFNVVLIDTTTDRMYWEGEAVHFEQAYASTDNKVAFTTDYRSLTGPRVPELDLLTLDRSKQPGSEASVQPAPLESVWPPH